MPPPYPNPADSAISVGTLGLDNPNPSTILNPSGSSKDQGPHTSPEPPATYADLSPEEQAAQDAEGEAAVHQAQNYIEADSGSDAQSVSDAGYETDSVGTASTSLASSVRDYAWENGRRYHRFREGSYNFPNDDSEQDREDMKHGDDGAFVAWAVPLCANWTDPQNVLDIGLGLEYGPLRWETYIQAQIYWVLIVRISLSVVRRIYKAIQLTLDYLPIVSPIQPEWVPPNVKFMVDDVESEWLRPVDHFDYVHSRHTVMAIRDWPKLMGRVLRHLKPGGWYEMQEIHHYPYCHDGTMPSNHLIAQYWGLIIDALARLGVNFNATLLLENTMREAGFVNVHTRIFHVPIGLWPRNKVLKKVGLYWRTILLDGAQPIALGPLTRGLGWTKEQVELWLIEVRKAYMDGWVHSHMPLYIICGQKPGPDVHVYGQGRSALGRCAYHMRYLTGTGIVRKEL